MNALKLSSCFVLSGLAAFGQANSPTAQISNGAITAKFYLPDATKGYYRGTRFDWSGQISSLKTAKHEYFGQWNAKYDPRLHDAIMGPVEEFRTNGAGLGYDEAKPQDTFIRIGVGVVRKPDEMQYEVFKSYDIVDPGKWTVKRGAKQITFVHDLKDGKGYAYRYTKTVRLVGATNTMVIEHSLKNVGRKLIETSQYNHNFFVMDGAPTGPDSHVEFPFELQPVRAFQGGIAESKGKTIGYNSELKPGQSVIAEFKGFGPTAADYDIKLENHKAGAGVRIRGDQPLSKVVYWSIRSTFCPEPYIDLKVAPGREIKWKYTYDFYDIKR